MRRLPLILLLGCALPVRAADAPPAPKVIERYKQMLATNPAEGTALERLWKAYSDRGETTALIDEYARGGTFSSELVLGHLLRRAGRLEEAIAAFTRAANLDVKSAAPLLALGSLQAES